MQLILSKGNESRVKNNQARLKLLCRDVAMSSSVSPRQRDIGEVASLRAEGVDRQPQSGFSAKIGKTATLMFTEPLRFLRKHLPYPRFTRGRGGHCAFANFTDLLTIDRYNSSCFPRRILPYSEIMRIAFSSAKFCQSKRKNVPLQAITKLSRHEKNFFVLISHRAFGILQ